MSDLTQRYLFGFWTLVDESLNSILLPLISLEVPVLHFDASPLPLSVLAIPVTVGARLAATASAVATLRRWYSFQRGTVVVLVWGGLRGGISIALAYHYPKPTGNPSALRRLISSSSSPSWCSGCTLGWVAKRVLKNNKAVG